MTEDKQPENQQKTHPTVLEQPSAQDTGEKLAPKSGRGLSLLALIISVATAGGSIYGLQQIGDNFDHLLEIQTKTQENALQNFASNSQIANLAAQLQTLDKRTQSLDTLDNTINAAIAASQPDEVQIAAIAAANSLSREQVASLIKQELATFAQSGQKIDLSKEIAAVEKSEAAVRATVAQIDEKAQAFARSIDEKQVLIEHALAQKNSSINPFPLINALKMAQIAAKDGNYGASKAYLDQAATTFSLFNLGQSHYAKYQNALTELRTQYGILAAKAGPAAQIDAIITTLPDWPYKNVNPLNLLKPEQQAEVANWQDRLKGIGQNILDKTVTVSKIDDAGLTWIQTNEALQVILKENLRLNLAYARNALQLHDQAAYTATADRLHDEIGRLFDTGNAHVASAMTTLEQLKNSNDNAPDIGTLIDAFEQATKE